MQSCEIYFLRGCVYVVSISTSEFGVGVSIGPMFKAASDSGLDVGSALNAALNASTEGIPHPKNKAELKIIQSQLFSFTHAKSWADLVRNAKHICIKREGSVVNATLSRAIKGGGLVPTTESLSCASDDVIGIGSNIRKLLQLPQAETAVKE